MANATYFLRDESESFLCSICLHVFTKPVTTPCGHNYCQKCINSYWDNTYTYRCPVCRKMFLTRPDLHVNTMLSNLALRFMASDETLTPERTFSERKSRPTLCDICLSEKDLAMKYCLVCLSSFCKHHLEPHLRLPGLRTHTLMDPNGNIDHMMCKTHKKITELYCKTDNTCICVMCIRSEHRYHSIVSLEDQYEAVLAKKDDAIRNVRTRIQQITYRVEQCQGTVDFSQRRAEEEKQATVEVCSNLIRSIHKYQAEVVKVIEKKHQLLKESAEGCVSEMLKEISHLESNAKQLEVLSKSKDHHSFLLNFSSLTCILPTHLPKKCVHTSDLMFLKVRQDVALQNEIFKKMTNEISAMKVKTVEEACQKILDHF